MPYDYDMARGVNSLDTITPVGMQEPGTSIDDAIRQVLAYLTDASVGPDARATELAGLLEGVTITENVAPSGLIFASGLSVPPTGFVMCNGQSLSKTTYSALYAKIGGTFGEDSTTFKVPDLRGRIIVNKDTSSEFGTIGGTCGSESHKLLVSEMPAHTHSTTKGTFLERRTEISSSILFLTKFGNGWTRYLGNTPACGGDQIHSNVQPVLTLNYFIKT